MRQPVTWNQSEDSNNVICKTCVIACAHQPVEDVMSAIGLAAGQQPVCIQHPIYSTCDLLNNRLRTPVPEIPLRKSLTNECQILGRGAGNDRIVVEARVETQMNWVQAHACVLECFHRSWNGSNHISYAVHNQQRATGGVLPWCIEILEGFQLAVCGYVETVECVADGQSRAQAAHRIDTVLANI